MTGVPFAINGLGRVGRALLRIAASRDDLRLVAVNDLVGVETLARLVDRDSVHGRFVGSVQIDGGDLVLDGRRVAVSRVAEPVAVPWAASGARVVVEATGALTGRSEAAGHLGGPVERVVLSANGDDADVTLCLGVNDDDYDPRRHRVISNASCTTNCLAPLVAVLDRHFGIERAAMTTVHSYTVNQRLLDLAHSDPRRQRAAALNMTPTATSAPQALGRILPHLAGRLSGMAIRVPTPMGALLELVAHLQEPASADEIRDAFRRAAAEGPLAGILAISEEELVSSDFVGDPHSAVVDLPLVEVADHRLARVAAWYDNEWGYASRLADLVARL